MHAAARTKAISSGSAATTTDLTRSGSNETGAKWPRLLLEDQVLRSGQRHLGAEHEPLIALEDRAGAEVGANRTAAVDVGIPVPEVERELVEGKRQADVPVEVVIGAVGRGVGRPPGGEVGRAEDAHLPAEKCAERWRHHADLAELVSRGGLERPHIALLRRVLRRVEDRAAERQLVDRRAAHASL